jgi:AcrR family transcriptional regulator
MKKATGRKIAASTSRGGAPAQERKLRNQGKETLRKLLDAGMIVFEKRGYHAARVDDIVKVAKTSHGTFYLYFANKEELFRALADDVAAEMTDLADDLPALTPGPKGQHALAAWLGRFADVYTKSGPVIRAWTEAEIGGSEFGQLGTDTLAEFARVLARRIRDAEPRGLEPRVAALVLVAMTERLNYYCLTEQVPLDRDAMVATLAAVTHRSLFGT